MPASPEAGSTRPRRKILSGIALALTLLASLMAFASTPVDAVVTVVDAECYVEVQQSQYKRQTYETKYTYTKYVSNYFWSSPSSWSLYAGGAWTQTVTTGGEPHPYLSSAGNPITANGLFHQSGLFGSQRNYRYQITNDEQVATGWEYSDWVTEHPGDGWILVDTKTVKGDTFPCPTATATPGTCEGPGEITPSTSEHYTHEIEDGVVTFIPVAPAVFGGDVQTEFDFSETIAQLEGEECAEEVDVAVSASVSYECDADVTVTLNSDGDTEFEISVNGDVVSTETVSGTANVVVTITETSTVVVSVGGEEIFEELVEYVDCGDVLGDDEEAPEEEDNGEVAGDDDEAAEATGAATLPMTGASAGLLTLLAGMAMGLGATLRTISRRFR